MHRILVASTRHLCRSASTKVLTNQTINARVLQTEYAVRGELVIKADQLKQAIAKGEKLPFNKLIMCNIGNPQSLRQNPLTFFRQVAALCEYPALMNDPAVAKHFPEDAIARAKLFLSKTDGAGLGAYSHSSGVPHVRTNVAKFLEARDGHPANAEDIYLTDGASPGIQRLLTMLIRDENDGIMTPIPQYPLYSASIALNGGKLVGYYLDEDNKWALQVDELKRSVKQARASGINPRALVVINPSNPTGAILSAENIANVIQFCAEEKLVLIADEVYQENIYNPQTKFISFKKVLRDMGEKGAKVELASFHSVSKGFLGECGHRGGVAELVNFDEAVYNEYYKLASICLCPNVSGQLIVDLMVNPPKKGDPSYEVYAKERDTILSSLARRAKKLTTALNSFPGMKCQPAEGAMYAFPQIVLSPKAVAAAQAIKKQPDFFYAMKLLEATGICVVPGSGFGQKDGSYHFRTTFLPPEDEIDQVIERMSVFHKSFVSTYA